MGLFFRWPYGVIQKVRHSQPQALMFSNIQITGMLPRTAALRASVDGATDFRLSQPFFRCAAGLVFLWACAPRYEPEHTRGVSARAIEKSF